MRKSIGELLFNLFGYEFKNSIDDPLCSAKDQHPLLSQSDYKRISWYYQRTYSGRWALTADGRKLVRKFLFRKHKVPNKPQWKESFCHDIWNRSVRFRVTIKDNIFDGYAPPQKTDVTRYYTTTSVQMVGSRTWLIFHGSGPTKNKALKALFEGIVRHINTEQRRLERRIDALDYVLHGAVGAINTVPTHESTKKTMRGHTFIYTEKTRQ